MKQKPERKSGKKKKQTVAPTPIMKLVKKPKVKRIKRAAPNHKCHICLRMVRVNREGFISWHRDVAGIGKWCKASMAKATKRVVPL